LKQDITIHIYNGRQHRFALAVCLQPVLLAGKQPLYLFRVCIAIGLLSQLDRIIISALLPASECDIPSFYHAWLRKKGRTFKRYKLFN
jgi:hypothetical protein